MSVLGLGRSIIPRKVQSNKVGKIEMHDRKNVVGKINVGNRVTTEQILLFQLLNEVRIVLKAAQCLLSL